MNLWERLLNTAGDVWASRRLVALWPWPAVVLGRPRCKFTWRDYRNFTARLEPGDFILTKSSPYFLSNAGIKGTTFKHLAVYVGSVTGDLNKKTSFIENPKYLNLRNVHHDVLPTLNAHQRCVVHAISEGVVCQDLGELLFHSDYAIVVRPVGSVISLCLRRRGLKTKQRVVDTALKHIARPYDFYFDQGDMSSVFCTELGRHICLEVFGNAPRNVNKFTSFIDWVHRKGHPVTLADSFLCYTAVCCSESCFEDGFGADSDEVTFVKSAIKECRK